eukprot:s256_g7.t1
MFSGLQLPAIDEGILGHLQRVSVTPLRLDAAFDTEDDCEELISASFPDAADVLKLDTAAQMMIWKVDVARPLKKAGRGTAADLMFRLPQPNVLSVQEKFQRLARTSAMTVLEMHTKRKQRKYKEDPPDVMIAADLPVVALVQTLDDPNAGSVHMFAARCGNTFTNRYKVWNPFEKWLERHRGYLYPKGVKDAIDCMQHRVDEGCGRTIPESLATTLGMLEQLGRVVEGSRISDDPVWKGHVNKSWAAELCSQAPPRKPAEMYTLAMVISLEFCVVDETLPIFQRALSWITLCMTWGAMRCDDVQAILPHRTSLSNYGLRMVLGKSKTTGPDKVQKEVAVHTFRTIFLSGEDWLRSGYELWETEQFRFRRGYMVMEPAPDWTQMRRKFVPPSGLSSLITKLLGMLPVPKKNAFGWEHMQHLLLLPDGLESFFTGHSPRNFLTSIGAAIGFSRDERAYWGRWSMGMVSSEEYVRTARQVVFKIQRAVNPSLVEGRDQPYFEDEAIQRLCDAAESNGANPNRIKKRHSLLSNWSGRHSLGGVYPTLEVLDGDIQELDDDDDEANVTLAYSVAKLAEKERQSSSQDTKYFITISRRSALRRLHLTGCFVKPGRCCEVLHLNEVVKDDFDSFCQACRRKMLSECGREENDDASSTASSSSTASELEPGNSPLGD